MMEYDILAKAVIIGDSGVGKSSLLYRYVDNDWSPIYVATIGVDFKIDTFETEGKIVKLQMWDTAGQERFKTICASYYRGAHCVMLVYDVTNRESFHNVKKWVKEVHTYARPNIPMILVGNKADLTSQRTVTAEEATQLAEELGIRHVEASAKSALNVHHAFRDIAKDAAQRLREMPTDTEKQLRFIRLAEAAESQPTCMQRILRFFRA